MCAFALEFVVSTNVAGVLNPGTECVRISLATKPRTAAHLARLTRIVARGRGRYNLLYLYAGRYIVTRPSGDVAVAVGGVCGATRLGVRHFRLAAPVTTEPES